MSPAKNEKPLAVPVNTSAQIQQIFSEVQSQLPSVNFDDNDDDENENDIPIVHINEEVMLWSWKHWCYICIYRFSIRIFLIIRMLFWNHCQTTIPVSLHLHSQEWRHLNNHQPWNSKCALLPVLLTIRWKIKLHHQSHHFYRWTSSIQLILISCPLRLAISNIQHWHERFIVHDQVEHENMNIFLYFNLNFFVFVIYSESSSIISTANNFKEPWWPANSRTSCPTSKQIQFSWTISFNKRRQFIRRHRISDIRSIAWKHRSSWKTNKNSSIWSKTLWHNLTCFIISKLLGTLKD